jgi:hypothetical protein
MTGIPAELRAAICDWMAVNGYAIGHGDTIKELLDEINWQAVERGRKSVSAPSLFVSKPTGLDLAQRCPQKD